MNYNTNLKLAMEALAGKPDTMFIGQSVKYAGTGMFNSLIHVPEHRKIEFPVVENLQLGVSTGLALQGFVPISIFPRWNFLLSATDQIVNHLDKLSDMSSGGYTPRVIIRVAKGSENPINPQEQHKGNFTDAFKLMCKNIIFAELNNPEDIIPTYLEAYNSKKSWIITEFPDYGK